MHVKTFQHLVLSYYAKHARDLPWRNTTDPYAIIVSEIMLQQTQVERVIEKYKTFLVQFPSIYDLAKASLADVLLMWHGLGYNRRAKYLHELAHIVVHKYNGTIPQHVEQLVHLPGIGSATAAAIVTYTWNNPVVFVETNIRTVFLYHFFSEKNKVSDKEIVQIVEKTLYMKDPRTWYWALMDYGSMLKKERVVRNTQSTHFVKQSRFEGSTRQIRGRILTTLIQKKRVQISEVYSTFAIEQKVMDAVIAGLVKNGLIALKKGYLQIQGK